LTIVFLIVPNKYIRTENKKVKIVMYNELQLTLEVKLVEGWIY